MTPMWLSRLPVSGLFSPPRRSATHPDVLRGANGRYHAKKPLILTLRRSLTLSRATVSAKDTAGGPQCPSSYRHSTHSPARPPGVAPAGSPIDPGALREPREYL